MPISEVKSLSLLFCLDVKIAFLIAGIVACNPHSADAQIIPDRTLPNNSTVTNNQNTVEINGGTVRGKNLFHSFSEFSINPDNLSNVIDTAYFNNGDNITTIFSRITGNSISEINGLIKANGNADLFLINPNGIIFGENASLDIGGSFISSTADSIKFAGEKEFSTVNPQANSLLTVNIPVGLQYGEQPQDISVLGSVLENQALTLIGGNIFVEGGNLTTSQGNIALGSVGSDQTVGLNSHSLGWELDYAAENDFGKIRLSEAASIEVRGDSGGRVKLQGDFISLKENSAISTNTSVNSNNILIESNSLSIIDGGQIYLHTDGVEDGGNLNINAQEIELAGVDSGLFSAVSENAQGNGANINLQTNQLTIKDGAQIVLDTLGLGNGGNLNINAQEINLINDSGIFAHAITGIGNGGDIAIATDSLSIQDGARIYAGNFSYPRENLNSNILNTLQVSPNSLAYTIIGTGEVGNIDINASSIVLDSSSKVPSSISTSVYQQGGGIIKVNSDTISINNGHVFTNTKGESHGGSIYLDADTLYLSQGGKVTTNTFAAGNGGKIMIETGRELIATGENSGIFSQGDRNSEGNAGNIVITGNLVDFSNGSGITGYNFGLGKDGAISIDADYLHFDEDRVISKLNRKEAQLGNIGVAGFSINSNQLDQPPNIIELLQTINNPTELTVSTCTPRQNHDVAIKGQNLKFWRSPTVSVASQNLNLIYQQEPTASNPITEAKSWIVNSEGTVELLAESCY